jgi:hypothetical protein
MPDMLIPFNEHLERSINYDVLHEEQKAIPDTAAA